VVASQKADQGVARRSISIEQTPTDVQRDALALQLPHRDHVVQSEGPQHSATSRRGADQPVYLTDGCVCSMVYHPTSILLALLTVGK